MKLSSLVVAQAETTADTAPAVDLEAVEAAAAADEAASEATGSEQ
jgi:hypothetical protein